MPNAANCFAALALACLPAAYEVSCRIRAGRPTSFWLDSPRTVASRRFGSPVPRRRGLGGKPPLESAAGEVYANALPDPSPERTERRDAGRDQRNAQSIMARRLASFFFCWAESAASRGVLAGDSLNASSRIASASSPMLRLFELASPL